MKKLLLSLVLISFLPALILAADNNAPAAKKSSMILISYNIRMNTTADGVNAWPLRKEKVTGLLAFLPNIGAPISGALMILVGFSGGTDMGLYCIIVYLVVQTVDGNIIVPMVAKKTVDLAPALVLGAQLVFGVMFGILGLALADPMVAMLKIALERRSERNAADAEAA